eukprot:jgi/Tetstr1/460458/TSEL_005717.t1
MQRKGSSRHQFVKRIPTDLRERMIGKSYSIPIGDEIVSVTISDRAQAVRFSLRTSDPSEVKDRQASAVSYLERLFVSLRDNRPLSLTHRNAVALSGDLYRAWASDLEKGRRIALVHTDQGWVRDDDFDSEELEAEYAAAFTHVDKLQASDDSVAFERALGPIADRLLASRGIALIDAPSRQMLLKEFARALSDGFAARKRKARGDYSADPNAQRFPEWEVEEERSASGSVSLKGLVDRWWAEAEAGGHSPSTHESYRKAVTVFSDFLGHDDASRVSTDDVFRFKDHLLARINPRSDKPLSPKTVKDSYISGLRSVFGWAVANRKMASNPASGVKVGRIKRVRLRDPWFSHEETVAILSAATAVKRKAKEPLQRYAGKRWVPWLCAYTGARVGEMVQLRKKDVRREGDRWIITITPEAGTVKTKEQREVSIHPHLVEMGFTEFVTNAAEGPLFMWTGTERPAWRTAKNRLREFIRTIVSDPNIDPNHGWRHTFKTLGSEVGIQDKVLDAICGHAPRTEGESYGGVTIAAKALAMERFPRFKID